MVTLTASDGSLEVPDALVRAVVRHAERHADLVGTYLNSIEPKESKPVRFPAVFLLELAATLQLDIWERQGINYLLPADLPNFRDAKCALADRANNGLAEFDDPDSATLSRQVVSTLKDHFAWQRPEAVEAEIVLGGVDEDALIDVLAEFVWSNRRNLQQLLETDEESP